MNRNKGFTLIELLMVIGIIAVVASIVLTFVGGSTGRSNDAKTKRLLSNLIRTTEIYQSYNNNYGITVSNNCSSGMFADTNSDTAKFVTPANYPNSTTITCYATSSTWAVSASLSGTNNYWCVDYLGSSKSRSSAITGTSC